SKLREIREKDADDYKYSGIGIFHFANARKSYSLEYIIYADRTNPMTASITKTLPFLLVIVLIVSLLCAYIYTILFAKPVKQLSDVSHAMARMDFSRKCNPKRQDEIGDLGRDLDSMAETLDEKIRDLQHKNEELNEEVTRRVELESQKDMFFAAASHELKTPVTVLEGQIRGMLDGVGPYSDRDEYLARSLGTVKRMESLINEILTASKMQSGREITTSRTDMAQLLEEKMEECEELFSARGIKMELQIENDLIFEGNKDLTSIAIGAFLSNAAFYSEGGATVFVDAENVEDKLVRVTIRNTDAYIDETELAHLFEPFYRTDKSRSRRSGGSGLGLYLARLIIEKQGGSCRLENDGKDVLATIEIPYAAKG
ncbi:MAG: HAMP domain-containing histidine kinase, partial [Lachnospiraceae bacterium]|nr:HAMP domain-containing histidine kinase [Lachnospiraceae bacterium]